MNTVNEQLVKSWLQVYQNAEQAINWVKQTRSSSKRLNNEADNLILDLRRLRNTSKRLADVSSKSVAVGFFGLSQAGKSYLISALAASENGKLETKIGDQILDFIDHVNPVGSGKEATGLVTRFSRNAKGGVSGFPLELKLFSEIEIVKVLLNAYFKDFDQQRINNKIDLNKLNQQILQLTTQKQATPVLGINQDDIVDLYDYVNDNFGNSLEALKGQYWKHTLDLAPYLSIADRSQLFSVLWGNIDELSQIYCQLATTLANLNHTERVYAPLNVLIKEENGIISQSDSIMNVDMLERINTSKDLSVNIKPIDGDPIEVSIAELAFLTTELIFPLINKTRVSTFEHVDLLDFPGYRGRLNLASIDEIKDSNPIAQLLLRGKVAYLFEKYTDNQEMNVLVVCTPSDKQSDVNDVGPVLERWITKTQGETPEKRSNKKTGLLWAITMFDKRIASSLQLAENNLKNSWGKGGLLQQTILERFGHYNWLTDWSNGQKFNNIYLVRKPGFDVPFLDVDPTTHKELDFNPSYQSKMQQLKESFIQNSDIKEYIANQEQVWDNMLCLNDGGMTGIAQYLEQVAVPQIKQQRITEQLNENINYIVDMRFDSWYQADNDQELVKKKQTLNEVIKALQNKALLLGELLNLFVLPEDTLRRLYHSTDKNHFSTDTENTISTSFDDFALNVDFNLFADTSLATESKAEQLSDITESKFATAVFTAWIEHLRNIVLDKQMLQFFGLEQKYLSFIIEEIITGANRLNIAKHLTQCILQNENTGNKRDDIVSRQVSSIHILLADFIAWLGFINGQTNVPMSHVNQGKTIFSSPLTKFSNNSSHLIPILDEKTRNYSQYAIFDWFIAFATMAQENIGHQAGREISSEQNNQLGEIVANFKTNKIN